MDKVPRKIVSVNFSHALLSLLCILFNVGLGLALRGPVQSDLVWHGPSRYFTCEFKAISQVPNLSKKFHLAFKKIW